LHELGHIWCCEGEGAGPDRHWLENLADRQLVSVNRFGLMTQHPTCRGTGASLVCARRFGERELRTMGFHEIPPPLADPCSTEFAAVDAQVAATGPALEASAREIEEQRAAVDELEGQLRAIDARYPTGKAPAEV